MDRNLLTIDAVGAITRQVSSALAFMHKQRRTHNDIKPENILLRVTPSGGKLIAKLADLGLADHSVDRVRDFELFAYTVWSMTLERRFEKCPTRGSAERDAALDVLHKFVVGVQECNKQVALALEAVVLGLWNGNMDMMEVSD